MGSENEQSIGAKIIGWLKNNLLKILFIVGTGYFVFKLFDIFISISQKIISAKTYNNLHFFHITILIVLAFIIGYVLKLIYLMIKDE